MSNSIQTRATYNLRLSGAKPGFTGATRHVIAALASAPDATSEGLFIKLRGSMRDRLLALGVPSGLVPEFTGVLQHLGVFRHVGAGTATTWFVMDLAFAGELLREPWVTKAFADHLERAELHSQIRCLKGLVGKASRPAEPAPAPPVEPLEALKEFFVNAFRDFHDPTRGEGLHLGHDLRCRFDEASFTLDLDDAIAQLDAEGFLRSSDRCPQLVWRGIKFPDSAPVQHLRVVAR